MNRKVIQRIGLGVFIYISLVVVLIMFNPDDTSSMGWEDRQEYNKVQLTKLKIGDLRATIVDKLGPPDITEAKQVEGKQLQVMFYRTTWNQSDGITTQDECTPLLFEEDKLIAWGDGTYQNYLKL